MFIDNEPIIAQCPLERGSVNKTCYLSFKKLLISVNGRVHKFDLSQVQGYNFRKKLLLLPLIVGGILAPLSLIALLNSMLDIWIMLISFMAGSLLIYYGLEGRNALSIVTRVKEYDFFVTSISKNLTAFLDFANKIKNQNGEPKFYIDLSRHLIHDKVEFYDFQKGVELYESHEELVSSEIFAIEPLSAGAQIAYREDGNGNLTPYLIGKIRKESLVKVSV